MKTPLLIAIALLLAGCATSNYSTGKDFDSAAVSKIDKGKTTKAELLAWFGEPQHKTVSTDGGELLVWTVTNTKTKVTSYVLSANMKQETTGKRLVATVKGGVVASYSFTEGTLPPVFP